MPALFISEVISLEISEVISLVLFLLNTKGVFLMSLFSLADSCRLLAIDAKTLCRWLRLAHISVQAHPVDARLKCVTREQIQHLAAMHRRTLPASSEQPSPVAPSEVRDASIWSCVVSEASSPITQLTQQLGSLQAQVATLQHQLALLTEQLQKEQQWHTSVMKTFEDKPAESSLDKPAESSLDKPATPASIDRRKHPRVLPLVEYGAQGNYVVISPEEGLLSFEPDSPEWFAWLATLPSFRFVGQQGRFTAFRGYQCSPSTPWWAHRQIRNHSHKHRIGTTASMTIAGLERAAASLQALVK